MLQIVVVIEFSHQFLVVVDHAHSAVVVIDIAVSVGQAHIERRHVAETIDLGAVFLVKIVEQVQAVHGVIQHLVDRDQAFFAVQKALARGHAQVFIDPARDRADAVHFLAEHLFEHLLAPFAQHHHALDQRRVGLDQTDHVALLGCGVHAEQHFRHDQIKIRRHVRLQHLRVVAEAAHFLGRWGDVDAVFQTDAYHVVEHLGAAQMVADKANAADALQEHGRFPIRVALDEFLEAAKLHHMQLGIGDLVVVVELHHHLAVTLDASHRINNQFSAHDSFSNLHS